MKHDWKACGAAAALVLGFHASASADEGHAGCDVVTRDNVAGCAVSRSADVRAEREGLAVVDGRQLAASTLLPANPTVQLNGGQAVHLPFGGDALMWGAAVSQEVEVAGQRGRRLEVVHREREAQQRRVHARAREVAAAALVAYFDRLAAAEERRLADRLAALAEALRVFAQARAESGLAAAIEGSLAQAQAVRLLQLQLATERRLGAASATLGSALGLDPARPSPDVRGALEPLRIPDLPAEALVGPALAARADVRVAAAEADMFRKRADLLRATRVPNPIVSLYWRKDWIGEEVAGVALAVPIPLPAPIGRTNAGEIAEATALAAQTDAGIDRLRRRVRLEVTRAAQELGTRRREAALFRPEDLKRAEEGLMALGDELRAQRIGVRDALLMQQTLVEMLVAHLEARRQLCFAAVELARVAALPLAGETP